jgi:predicted CXXCH cytochrome family protein
MRRRAAHRAAAALTLLCALAVSGQAGLAQGPRVSKMLYTKHNLSATGPGSIKAVSENQICVFCHTPHVPAGEGSDQLWNHQLTTASYTLYSSDYLTKLTYTAPNQPNARSRLCLSCHDGTVALGAVYNNMGASAIEMQSGVNAMPATAAGYIGTSLANDHPVGYTYDNAKDPELAGRTWPWQTPIKLDPDASNGTVECITCHEPHDNSHGMFLRIDNTNAALCTFCHTKNGWPDAIHKTSTQALTPPGGSSTTLGERACRNCHQSHGGGGVPYLMKEAEENTCFDAGCHGSASTGQNTKNIRNELEKSYSHPTLTVSGKHKNPDDASSLGAPARHAECQDCHNLHQAQKGLHAIRTNQVSGALKGVAGYQPVPVGSWTQPTSFTEIKPSVFEYQICYKCHTSYAFGQVANGVTTIQGPSAELVTDQAMEFNNANRSAHPVEAPSGARTGSLPPNQLSAAQMTADWNSAGTQTMYCSDCHGDDQPTSSTVPQGPHGSNSRFMLSGTARFWPSSAFGSLWSLDDIANNKNNWQNDLFCVNCHPMNSAGAFTNNVHAGLNHQGADVKCVTCHVTVPHGSKRSRLIGYASDVQPYNFNGAGTYDRLVITGFQKASGPQEYLKANCSMNGVCHGTQAGIYEQ